MKTTAIQVAQELRRLADALEKGGDAEICPAFVSFRFWGEKEQFLTAAKLLPRPFKKEYPDNRDIRLTHENDAISVWVSAPRSLACRLVTPAREAVYECEPLLSEAEEAEVSA